MTPSDSVALLAASAADAIPYFKGGLKVFRPTPTPASELTKRIHMPSWTVQCKLSGIMHVATGRCTQHANISCIGPCGRGQGTEVL